MKSEPGDELLFSAAFPLPFRVLCLAGLGILGWATNLHGLHVLGLDASSVLDIRYDGRRLTSPLPIHRTPGWKLVSHSTTTYAHVYKLFVAYSLWTLAAWLLFRYATYGDVHLVDAFKFIPAIAAMCLLTALINPFNVFYKLERDMFLHAIQRCLFSPISNRVLFADIVFADVFTSFAKVLGDVWLSICMLLPGGSLLAQPAQDGLSRWILPTLMSLPYAVRFRQCVIEYMSPMNESRRPLFNALKYASSFPVIYLSAAQRIVVSDLMAVKGEGVTREAWHGEHQLFRLWLLAAAVNSLYSFWWDVTHDWGCDLLLPHSPDAKPGLMRSPPKPLMLPRLHSRSSLLTHPSGDETPDELSEKLTTYEQRPYPYGLRPTLVFPLPVYSFAILVDLVLRLTWSVKLSSHLHSYSEGDLVIFWIELAELVRRWVWVFIRVEWEVVKETREGRSPPSSDSDPVDRHADADYEMIPSDYSTGVSEGG